ncbi:hypothetical protein [Silvibacterium sp.]|uniref:hypothetical protein n=1 Tax=Silvibacterium sp. TaxID=1964179 RepID=UPI0039E6697E
MRALAATLFLLCTSLFSLAQSASFPGAEGILHTIENARAASQDEALTLTRIDRTKPITLTFAHSQSVGVERDHDAWWVLPLGAAGADITVNSALWVLPEGAASHDASWYIELHGSAANAALTQDGLSVHLEADDITLHRSEARPHSDVFGHTFAIDMKDGRELENTLATFYWGTMLPSVVERTLAAKFPYSNGYVLSTLETSKYAGSYPAVDHEFQIWGRLAFGSPLELDLVRRMIELQFQLMDDDPEHLSRAPTSVQPDGRREYHIRRDSEDHRENAGMFPVTGNIEVLQESWRWYEATKDRAWLAAHIGNLERAAEWVLANTDQYGRVWSDVYYEDQVIKDGRETQAQAFAAHAFALLARMEELLGRTAQAASYQASSAKMAKALVAPLPLGFWDEANHRFVDWVDRNGQVHDHVHLLANTLPVTLDFATAEQRDAVQKLIAANSAEFERFPSFLSAHIDAYTPSEIGIAGPYDLSATGRYWYWDAAYRASQHQNALLLTQLKTVAAEAAKSKGFMGERYDMDHVYYVDGKNAHGAGQYYEYPNVFTAVLISQYLGLSAGNDSDVLVAPHLADYGSVEFRIPAYDLSYRWDQSGFTLTNLSEKPRRFAVDLSALTDGHELYRLEGDAGRGQSGERTVITLAPKQQARWIRKR